jgi:hypothetical protein
MFTLNKPSSILEIQTLVEIYIQYNNNDFFIPNYKIALDSAIILYKQNAFIQLIKEDNEIIGGIIATVIQLPYFDRPCLYQNFYISNQKGIKSFNAIKLTHNALIEYAERNKISYVISGSSPIDETQIFTRVLEKQGWIRKGHLALWKTSHAGRPQGRQPRMSD